MRVSQIQNLTWAGNVLVLAGLVWVGFQFWQAKKMKPAGEWKWQAGKTEALDAPGKRWPGEITAFEAIWKTPLNGKFPPPPKAPEAPVVKLDRVAEFKSKFAYKGGGMLFPSNPSLSTVRVSYEGKEMTLSPGMDLAGFQLSQYVLVAPDPRKAELVAKLVFLSLDDGKSFEIVQPSSGKETVVGPGGAPWERGWGPAIGEGGEVTEKGALARRAFQDPSTGDWIIPSEERSWIEQFGEKNLWSRLGTKPDADAQGNPRGLRITTLPEEKTPLAPTHGISVGDVIRSINGVPMTSKEDVLSYLRGDGKSLERYEVVIDTNGRERTVVYRVSRPRARR